MRTCRYCFATVVLIGPVGWGSVPKVYWPSSPNLKCPVASDGKHRVLRREDAVRDLARVYWA